MFTAFLARLAPLVLLLPAQGDRPALEDALGEADVIVVGQVVGTRALSRPSGPLHATEIRVESSLFGAGEALAVFVRSSDGTGAVPGWKPGERGIFLLDELSWYRRQRTAADTASPLHLYQPVGSGYVPLQAAVHGDVPDLQAFEVPDELLAQPEAGRGAPLLTWIDGVVEASTPRLCIAEFGNFLAPRSFVLEPDGRWTLSGRFVPPGEGAEPGRAGRLDAAAREAIFHVVDPERFFTLPVCVGQDESPCLDWVSFELRTRSGVHEVHLFDLIEGAEERAADAYCRRIFDALPIDAELWRLR